MGDVRPVRDVWGKQPPKDDAKDKDAKEKGKDPGFFEGRDVDSALVWQGHTYLISGDQYVRYTGTAYQFVDPGYPQPLAGNTEGLPRSKDVVVFYDARYIYTIDNAAEPSGRGKDHAATRRN